MDKKFILLILSGIIVISLMGIFTVHAIHSDNLSNQLDIANNHFDREEYEKSIEAYINVLELDPLNVNARLGLSKAYLAISNFDQAKTILLEGIELIPIEESFYSNLAHIYIGESEVIAALKILENGISITDSSSLQETYESINESIFIKSRTLVQKEYSRKLELVWEKDSGETIPLTANWQVLDNSIGIIEESETNDKHVDFFGIEVGETVVRADVEDFSIDKQIIVREQVLENIIVKPQEHKTLAIGQPLSITLEGLDAAGNPIDFNPEWSMSNKIGELETSSGLQSTFTAFQEGQTTISIRYEDYQKQFDLNIEGENKTISYETTGGGEVIIFPGQTSYPIDSLVTIEARPKAGWKFIGWGGDLEGESNPANITVTDHLNIQAIFEEELTHTLSLDKTGDGEIIRSSMNSEFTHMDTITLTARPSSGWTFKGWEGSEPTTNDRITVTMNNNKSFKAIFVKKENNPQPEPTQEQQSPTPSYTLSLGASEGGQIRKDQSGNQFKNGTKVNLTALPNPGWKFDRWEGAISGTSGNATITMNENKNVRAVFSKEEPKNFNLSTTISGDGTISGVRNGSYTDGSTATITAVPAEGWEFDHWEGDASGNNPSLSITINRDMAITAVFKSSDLD
ncbi:InlB B-repeat-containing protein [Halalkalibacter okhensis]|uniref:Bacterial repeat domain-containing protein n=1 Tax=Halalkalibacter okhensis TaxID=333138 RepID=A0A0B0IBQ1_9BACI|nr:tetratricopeptide repeat protein [Halalkalibacter okhensis]KHF38720.1 hypothetical protein LQ50_19795 [Halalkalibacter okhensis]